MRPGGASSNDTLVRRGTQPESAESLAEQAAKAEANGFPHGVSVTSPQSSQQRAPGIPVSSATRGNLEQAGLPVHYTPTRPDPYHHTIELPKPVTESVAHLFNFLFGR